MWRRKDKINKREVEDTSRTSIQVSKRRNKYQINHHSNKNKNRSEVIDNNDDITSNK